MAVSDFIRIIPLKTVEPNLTWEQFCQDPYKLLVAFSQYFAVEGKFLENVATIIKSSKTPQASDRNKVWIKTSKPYGIGIFVDGSYQMIYSNYIPNTPFLADPLTVDTSVQGLNQLSSEQITAFGLTDTNSSAANRYRWYMFSPGEIT